MKLIETMTTKMLSAAAIGILCRRHLAHVINGKSIADRILNSIKVEVDCLKEMNKPVPHLNAILVGNDPVSAIYIKNKIKAATRIGINTEVIHLNKSATESEVVQTIYRLNENSLVDGILLQLPLPEQISDKIGRIISPKKDVDGFTFENFGKFCLGAADALIPCTALAVREIILQIGENLSGKNALICGRSRHVGLPIALLLQSPELGFNATTIVCHRNTPLHELTLYAKSADIIISATGVAGLISGCMVKNGAIVIDVGIVRVTNAEGKTRILGDVNFKEVEKVANYITPVPGGVGPLTVAMLMKNTMLAAKLRRFNNFSS